MENKLIVSSSPHVRSNQDTSYIMKQVVIATFVTMVGMLLKAYIPALGDALGLFIPLIVVNCLILARAESFASKNTPIKSAVDGIGMGLGFTLALTALGVVREILGNGTLFGMGLFGVHLTNRRYYLYYLQERSYH